MFEIYLIIVIALFAVNGIWNIVRWFRNNSQPEIQVESQIVAIDRSYSSMLVNDGDGGVFNFYPRYTVTFELRPNGLRKKVTVPVIGYEMITEGDIGILTLQGTRFIDFKCQDEAKNSFMLTRKGTGNQYEA